MCGDTQATIVMYLPSSLSNALAEWYAKQEDASNHVGLSPWWGWRGSTPNRVGASRSCLYGDLFVALGCTMKRGYSSTNVFVVVIAKSGRRKIKRRKKKEERRRNEENKRQLP